MSSEKKYRSVIPYLVVKDAAKALEFYKKAFNAKEVLCMRMPTGQIVHAELQIGDSMFMFTEEHPKMGAVSPMSLKGSPVFIHLYVDDVDQFVAKATNEGLKTVRPLQNQFYGDRSGHFEDPFGHQWSIATRIEEVSEEDLNKRFDAMMQQGTGCHAE